MKTLILILLSTACFSQCPEDLWKRAILIGDEPMEVQIGEGQHMVLIVFERKDASKVQTWVISQKGTTPIPQPKPEIKIEAESATSLVNAAVVGTIVGHIRGDLPGGMVIKYPVVNLDGRTKVRFRYSRGYPGNGTMTMKIGTVSHTLVFPSTGGWGDYKEIEFPVSGSGAIEITSNELGSANFDWFSFL